MARPVLTTRKRVSVRKLAKVDPTKNALAIVAARREQNTAYRRDLRRAHKEALSAA